MTAKARRVQCYEPECGKQLTTSPMTYPMFRRVLRDQGWRYLGTNAGFRYFCGEHSGQ